jgi:hypothetical protein
MRARFLLPLVIVSMGVLASTARADGLPLLGTSVGAVGLDAPNGHVRFATLPAGSGTILVRTERDGGRVLGYRYLRERLTIPAVAYDGSLSGFSHDGTTLVLIRPRRGFPRHTSPFVLVDAKTLSIRDSVTLRGDFSFDAISPDGGTLYFIQYLSAKDPTRYAVRAYDVQAARLLREPVVDRSEPDEDMHGNPLSRVTSTDGRWAYTLYDGAGMAPFVHALDTVGAEAHCIDLDSLAGRNDLFDLRLRRGGGGTLVVSTVREPLAVIDLATLQVTEPTTAPGAHEDQGLPWLPIGGGIGLLAAAAGGLLLLRRRRLAPT